MKTRNVRNTQRLRYLDYLSAFNDPNVMMPKSCMKHLSWHQTELLLATGSHRGLPPGWWFPRPRPWPRRSR